MRAVSSRQEQKEQAKRERLEREAAEQKAAKRKRLLQIIGGVVVGAVVVVGVVLAIAGGGKDDERDATDLTAAAKAAGCTVKIVPRRGRGARRARSSRPRTTRRTRRPPATTTSTPAPDGVYAPGNEPEIENWVHTLEHGRILFQYKPGTPAGAHRAAAERSSTSPSSTAATATTRCSCRTTPKMPFAVAAVAWRHYVGCPEFTDKSIDALRAFREVYVDTAPEKVP